MNFLKELGYQARRTQQYCGTEGNSDITCNDLPHIHFEVKRTETLQIYKAVDQAENDRAHDNMFPVVVHRKNGREWIVILRADDFLELIKTAQ